MCAFISQAAGPAFEPFDLATLFGVGMVIAPAPQLLTVDFDQVDSFAVEPQGAVDGGIIHHMRLGKSRGEQLGLGGAFVHHAVDQVSDHAHHAERLPVNLFLAAHAVQGVKRQIIPARVPAFFHAKV
jgi:hypothetical protein